MRLPHVWGQDVPADWEGPATYSTEVDAGPRTWLLFHGAAYEAVVHVDGQRVAEHRSLWLPFAVDLRPFACRHVRVEVAVTKFGGPRFPVRDVASGFLPYVWGCFGGLYRPVERVETDEDPSRPAPAAKARASVDARRVLVDGKPFHVRGVLSWGWYPQIGAPNPDRVAIAREVDLVLARGFNLVKFCLWCPPHEFLEVLAERGAFAWMELPLWMPTQDPALQAEMADELERIARHYARHGNVVLWSIGCELDRGVPADFRRDLVERVRRATGSPLVGDSSGGSEMYAGDPREFGDFADFHPYCDLPFYPEVLDSLAPGPRRAQPTLLGEFDDYDTLRDLDRIAAERPYWASTDACINPQGARWEHVLPGVVAADVRTSPWLADSLDKASFIRRAVREDVAAREWIAGFVVTGLRDTPISASGMQDDWGEPKPHDPCAQPDVAFLLPRRRPPWARGGNRPGWVDPWNVFAGPTMWHVGVRSEEGGDAALACELPGAQARVHATRADPDEPTHMADVFAVVAPGEHELAIRWGDLRAAWPLWVVEPPSAEEWEGWDLYDPDGLWDAPLPPGGANLIAFAEPPDLRERLDSGARVILIATHGPAAPFWRECATTFPTPGPLREAFHRRWSRMLPVGGDSVLDLELYRALVEPDVLMGRIDTRTYAEAAYVARIGCGTGVLVATSLRPHGGIGRQPTSLALNPAGVGLLRALRAETCPRSSS